MLHTKYQGSRPNGFRQEDFSIIFPIITYVKHVIPGSGPFFAQWYNLNKLGRGPLGHATYQISRFWTLWFQTRRCLCFPYISLYKNVTPGAGPFLVPGHKLNKLGRSPLDDATYQISRTQGFRQEDFFTFSLYKANEKHVTLGRGHFRPWRDNLNKLDRGVLVDATY